MILFLMCNSFHLGDQLLTLKGDDTFQELLDLHHAIQLIRLGSEEVEDDDEDTLNHRSLPHVTSSSPSYAILSYKQDQIEAQLQSNSAHTYSLPSSALYTKVQNKKEEKYDTPTVITISAEVYGSSFHSDQIGDYADACESEECEQV